MDFAASTSAVVHSKSATAGNSSGAKCRLAPSRRTDAVVTVTSPTLICGRIAPVVPIRRKVRMPSCASSSTAIEVDGPPIPVEQTITGLPSSSARRGEFAVRCQLNRLIHQRGDLFHTIRVARTMASVAPCKSFLVRPR